MSKMINSAVACFVCLAIHNSTAKNTANLLCKTYFKVKDSFDKKENK